MDFIVNSISGWNKKKKIHETTKEIQILNSTRSCFFSITKRNEKQ